MHNYCNEKIDNSGDGGTSNCVEGSGDDDNYNGWCVVVVPIIGCGS